MKTPLSILALTTLLGIAPMGCSPSDPAGGGAAASSDSPSVGGLDLSQVQTAFASASETVKTELKKIADSVKNADYAGAMEKLQALANNAELSADQKSALNGLLATIKAKSADIMKGASETAGKAVDHAKEAAAKVATQVTESAHKAATQATDAAKKSATDLLPK